MEAIFQWIFQQNSLGWVLFVASWIGIAVLITFGRLVTGPQVERDDNKWRVLTSSVERWAQAQSEGAQALRDLQTSVRNLEEGQRTELHALESFQRAREEQR